jgi:hypothetical protein
LGFPRPPGKSDFAPFCVLFDIFWPVSKNKVISFCIFRQRGRNYVMTFWKRIYLNDCEGHSGHLINVSKSDSLVRNKFKKDLI